MKRGRTAITARGHEARAFKASGISRRKTFVRMVKRPGAYIDELIKIERLAFGSGPNPKVSVLLVPELRKRRSERDPVLLKQQIEQAANTEAAIRRAS